LTNKPQFGEDGAPSFVFGSTFARDSVTSKYFAANEWKDDVKIDNNTITWPDHTQMLLDAGIKGLMFGAGVGISTSNLYMAQTAGLATDSCYNIVKFQDYYISRLS
jgi:hypothetical protein